MFSKLVDNAIENELKRTLSVLENNLSYSVGGIENSVNSATAESFRSKNSAIIGSLPSASRANNNFEGKSFTKTNNNPNPNHFRILSRMVFELMIERTAPQKGARTEIHHKHVYTIRVNAKFNKLTSEDLMFGFLQKTIEIALVSTFETIVSMII